MTLQDQVTSLELSKKLKELGVRQESLAYWYPYVQDVAGNDVVRYEVFCGERERASMLEQPFYEDVKSYSAFTVAELYQLHYQKFGTMDKIPVEVDPTDLTNYIAKRLIYNLENYDPIS